MSNEYYFDRIAQVRIGKAGETGFLTSKLRIEFHISKTTKADSNKCSLSIYNLSDKYSYQITANDGVIVELMAGYNDNQTLDLIFLGDVISVLRDDSQPDRRITLELEDGGNFIRKQKLSLSLKSGVTVKDAILAVLDSYGGNYQNKLLDTIPNVSLNVGLAFAGYASDFLNLISKAYNLEWSIQNGILQINDISSTVYTTATYLRAIKPPSRIYKNRSKDESDTNFNGYRIHCLLQPKVIPGGQVIFNNSKFKVLHVSHNGDTFGNNWETIITVKDIENA
jgi:hypothetical protein